MTKSYEEYKREKKGGVQFISRIVGNLQAVHVVSIILLILVGNQIMKTEGTSKTVLSVVVGALALFIFLNLQKKKPREVLSEEAVKEIAREALINKIMATREFPQGTSIRPSIYCKLCYWGEAWDSPSPWKWEVGFFIEEPGKVAKEVKVIMNPWDGGISGIVAVPQGYDGTISYDLKIVPQEYIKEEIREPKGL